MFFFVRNVFCMLLVCYLSVSVVFTRLQMKLCCCSSSCRCCLLLSCNFRCPSVETSKRHDEGNRKCALLYFRLESWHCERFFFFHWIPVHLLWQEESQRLWCWIFQSVLDFDVSVQMSSPFVRRLCFIPFFYRIYYSIFDGNLTILNSLTPEWIVLPVVLRLSSFLEWFSSESVGFVVIFDVFFFLSVSVYLRLTWCQRRNWWTRTKMKKYKRQLMSIHGNIKQTRVDNLLRICFSWMEIWCVILL